MENKKWYSTGTHEKLNCLNCNKNLTEIAYLETDTMFCPSCRIPCIFYGGFPYGNVVQIAPEKAPEEIQKFIKWFQSNLSGLELLFLVGGLWKMGKGFPNKEP